MFTKLAIVWGPHLVACATVHDLRRIRSERLRSTWPQVPSGSLPPEVPLLGATGQAPRVMGLVGELWEKYRKTMETWGKCRKNHEEMREVIGNTGRNMGTFKTHMRNCMELWKHIRGKGEIW